MRILFEVLFIIAASAATISCGYKIFQIYQLSGYKTKPVLGWIKSTKGEYLLRYFALGVLAFIMSFAFVMCFLGSVVYYFGLIFYILFCVIFTLVSIKEKKKTPLRLTMRVYRCMALSVVLSAAFNFVLIKLASGTELDYALASAGLVLIPLIIALSHIAIYPLEMLINNSFKKRAKNKLCSLPSLIKIGITGSYGKTTTKNILAVMLSQKYKTAFSPSSFNTPMGLSRFINESLKVQDEVLIAEMGARQQGDIRELCDMVKPTIALITSIGSQHIQTFGSIENIIKTKGELIEAMGQDGVAYFADSGSEILGMYDECRCTKFLVGKDSEEGKNSKGSEDGKGKGSDNDGARKLDASYSDFVLDKNGCTFKLHIKGEQVQIQTSLLGKHIPSTIALCAMCAYNLGVDLQSIASACTQLQPVPHRLQLIDRGETIVLDDAYNANLQGASNALEVLGMFEGTKIVITPGLVELGKEENALNTLLGEKIADFADIAYLVGSRASFIKSGALQKGMPCEKIFTFDSLDEAMQMLPFVRGKKAVLFENDLPDNY